MDAQNSFDISSLPGNDVEVASPPAQPAEPATPAQPVLKKKAKKQAKKQEQVAPDKLVFTHEMLTDDFTVEALFEPVYEQGLVLGVTRKAWNGIRGRGSKKLEGLRLRMRKDGYEIAAKVEVPDGGGKLASAVYAKGDSRVVVLYGTEPGFGHTIKAIDD